MIEDGIKTAMEAKFVAYVPELIELASSAHGKGARKADSVSKQMARLAERAITDTLDLYENLQAQTFEEGIRSIGAELEVCELALAKKYAGLTEDAMRSVSGFSTTIEEVGKAQYLVNSLKVVEWFKVQAAKELLDSRTEGLEMAVFRIVSTSPVRAAGHVGRGLWWKVFEHVNRITRETQFGTLNAVRSQTMQAFNDLGELR
jgi:hypothetical protein